MKKAIRLISLLSLSAVLLFALAACGGGDKTPAPEGGTTGGEVKPTKTYIIASDTAFAPFEYLDVASQKYIGFDMDLLAAIAADQGFQYEMQNVGFDAACTAVQAGQADAMIAGMTIKEERLKDYDFSSGYFTDGQIMAVAKDSAVKTLEDLKGKTVAAKASTEGYTYATSIADQYGFKVTVYEDSPTMYAAVMQGIDAACFEDRTVVNWAIKSNNLNMQTVGEVINPKEYGFAVKKGTYPELIELFNKGLENLKANGEYDKLMEKYGF